jgi:hypothetical protein
MMFLKKNIKRKKDKKSNKTKYIVIAISIILLLSVGAILNHIIFKDIITDETGDSPENYPDDEEVVDSKCDVENTVLLNAINNLQKGTTLYKYFSKEMPLSTEIVESENYAAGQGCIVKSRISNVELNYVYIKSEDKAYGYSGNGINNNMKNYNTGLLYFYIKDFILNEDIQNKYKGYGTYPIDYDNSDKFYIEIREYNGEGKEGGKLVAKYTINLNTKKYTVEDYK